MSKKQNEKDIQEMTIEGPLNDVNVVQKSNPLFSLWKSSLTLSEFKILDTYLSRINSREPEARTVIFEKGELEKLLGVVKINQPELDKRLEHLQGTIINIGEGKNIDKITLFERSQAIQDEYGIWEVHLTASKSAMKYIFDIEKIGYFRYQIRNIVRLKSLNSYILFLYFEHSLFGRTHAELRIDVEELKHMLGCTAQSYSQFKEFNRLILKNCQKEINEKTDISYTYSTIRKNRKVAVVVFDVKKTSKIEINDEFPEQETKQVPQQDKKVFGLPVKNFLHICKNEFDENQMHEIFQLTSEINMPSNPLGEAYATMNFVMEMYEKMDKYAKNKGIDSADRRFAYFKKMIKNYKSEQ